VTAQPELGQLVLLVLRQLVQLLVALLRLLERLADRVAVPRQLRHHAVQPRAIVVADALDHVARHAVHVRAQLRQPVVDEPSLLDQTLDRRLGASALLAHGRLLRTVT